jgi:hypothetical protein
MTQAEASLIVRLMNTAANEGQGPDTAMEGDNALLLEAVELAGLGTPWWAESGHGVR